jgi:poly-gamma-glutamate synthesis protein (capsule biosynthesis protein)
MQTLRVMFGGDVMLGRNVATVIDHNGAAYPLSAIAYLFRDADLAIVNLECAITESTDIFPGAPKAFYFGASVAATETLKSAGIDLVSLANNHALDFGDKGLLDSIKYLKAAGIKWTGAGANLVEARAPAFAECKQTPFAMVAFCDHQEDFAAKATSPGIAWVDLDNELAAVEAFAEGLDAIRAGGPVHWPILSLHWGPNFAIAPSQRLQRLAHAAIDLGYGIVYGHSAHHFQGIEVYKGRPILYSTGDVVDDYMVDRKFRNDLQLLFELTLSRDRLEAIRLHPLRIDQCQARPATATDLDFIVPRMQSMCEPFGTSITKTNGVLQLHWPATTD